MVLPIQFYVEKGTNHDLKERLQNLSTHSHLQGFLKNTYFYYHQLSRVPEIIIGQGGIAGHGGHGGLGGNGQLGGHGQPKNNLAQNVQPTKISDRKISTGKICSTKTFFSTTKMSVGNETFSKARSAQCL